MKKLFLSPLFSSFFIVFCLALYYGFSYFFRLKLGPFDIEETGITELLTYVFYGLAGCVALVLWQDYMKTPRQGTYFTLIFLWLAALLREMGIQHWLAINDTTAIKINYFKNPAVPLYGKIIAALVIGIVVGAILYLLIKHLKTMIVGFFKYQTIYWTIASFGLLGLFTQLADRLPSKYVKATGIHLEEPTRFVLKIFEEGGESLLPLVFAIGLLQFHFILHKKISQNGDESTNTVLGSV